MPAKSTVRVRTECRSAKAIGGLKDGKLRRREAVQAIVSQPLLRTPRLRSITLSSPTTSPTAAPETVLMRITIVVQEQTTSPTSETSRTKRLPGVAFAPVV